MSKRDLLFTSIIFVLCVALFISIKSCDSRQKEVNEANQNIEALKDVTKKSVDALGRTVYEKMILMGNMETIEKLNADLAKELKATKARLVTIASARIKVDTIRINNNIFKTSDSTFDISFKHKKDFDTLNGISFNGKIPVKIGADSASKLWIRSDYTTIEDFKLRIKIFTGIKEEDGKWKAYARTDFPGVEFDVDGAVRDPEKSFVSNNKIFSVTIGPSFGYGIAPNGQLGFVPSLGLMVGLNIINF